MNPILQAMNRDSVTNLRKIEVTKGQFERKLFTGPRNTILFNSPTQYVQKKPKIQQGLASRGKTISMREGFDLATKRRMSGNIRKFYELRKFEPHEVFGANQHGLHKRAKTNFKNIENKIMDLSSIF